MTTDLVWGSEHPANDAETVHLLDRRGPHVALCGAPLAYAGTRYLEDRPLRESRCCAECEQIATGDDRTYPGG